MRGSKGASPVDLDTFLRQRKWRRWLIGTLGFVGLIIVALLDWSGLLVYDGSDLQRYDGQKFTVVRVVDGDTLLIDEPDGPEPHTRVRLWGIDTPELAREGRPADPGSVEATEAAKRWVSRHPHVTLVLQTHRIRDDYGRLLAYIDPDDGLSLNAHLVRKGFAEADDRWPHERREDFARLEEQAKFERIGLWDEDD
jgi:micrococcal nuclease